MNDPLQRRAATCRSSLGTLLSGGQSSLNVLTSSAQQGKEISNLSQRLTRNLNTQIVRLPLQRGRSQPSFPIPANPFTPGPRRSFRSYTPQYGPEYSDGNTYGGAVPFGSRYGYFVARPDRRNLGLGSSGFGGQSGSYGGYGGTVAKINPYANQESDIIPETLSAQGTYNQLPIWHNMKGQFGTRQASYPIGGVELNRPSVVRCKCAGSACGCIGPEGPVYESTSTRPGTYDIGIPAYGDADQNEEDVGTEFTDEYGQGGYINGPERYTGGGMLF